MFYQKASLPNKLSVVVFVLLFGGLGAYLILNSKAATPNPPVSSALPVISWTVGETASTVREGQTIGVDTGQWSNEPATFSYQWQDCDTSGNNCVNIPGETESVYTLHGCDSGNGSTPGCDPGYTIRAEVTATNVSGSATANTAVTGTVASTGAATYYVAYGGSDSNNGMSKSSPWAHAPGMAGCTANCALLGSESSGAHVPPAGIQIIFKGGDTWSNISSPSDSAANVTTGVFPWIWGAQNFAYWPGTDTNRIYLGVDKSWYDGSGWSRPKFDGGNPISATAPASCQYPINGTRPFWQQSSYVTVDNFEWLGWCWTNVNGGDSAVFTPDNGDATNTHNATVLQNYFHGWSVTAGSPQYGQQFSMIAGYTGAQNDYAAFSYNVIDGSDSTPRTVSAILWNCYDLDHNYISHVANMVCNNSKYIHDNTLEYFNETDSSDHGNTYEENEESSSPGFFYNNVVRHIGTLSTIGVNLWLCANSGGNVTTSYMYNNVVYDINGGGSANYLDFAYQSGCSPGGTYDTYNNTLQNVGALGSDGPNVDTNNHVITNGTSAWGSTTRFSTVITDQLRQSNTIANSAGYTEANQYAPSASGSPTVAQGANETSLCGTLPGLCSGTTAGVKEGPNGTIISPAVYPAPRPATGPWDIGAYQYSSAGSDIYIAQSQAGTGDGSSCANAKAIGFFNTSTNWGTGAGQIGPGTTVHLCGTIASSLTAQGSGMAGNPITMLWEPGASVSMSAANCNAASSSCINLSGQSYITLNGGTNGTLQVTDNGDQAANNLAIHGIQIVGSSNITIEYLKIQDIYVHHSGNAATTNAIGIWVQNVANFKADHNTFLNAGNQGIITENYQSDGNLTISNNDFSGDNWNVGVTAATNATQGPVYIFGNHFHDNVSWDDPSDNNHHNGIFCYTSGDTTYAPHYSGFYVYNNLFNGDLGANSTSWVTIQSCSDDTSNYYVFNNVFASTREPGNGDDDANKGIDPAYNNTFIGSGAGSQALLYMAYTGQHDVRNNIFLNGTVGEPTRSGCGGSAPTGWPCPTYSLNNNMYANSLGGSTTTWDCPPLGYTQYSWSTGWSHWLSCAGSYLSSGGADETGSFGPPGSSQTVTNPGIDANYGLSSGSPAIGTGQNLYSICNGQSNPGLGALCYSYTGPVPSGAGAGPNGSWTTPVARPATGPWDIGAYQYSSNPQPVIGDLNADGHVNIFDLSLFLSHWQQTGTGLPEDFNADNIVNIFDLSILLSHYGT